MLNINQFRESLLQELKNAGYVAERINNIKINGEREGIMIRNRKSPYSPVFYLEPLYETYMKGYPVLSIIQMMEREIKISEPQLPSVPDVNGITYLFYKNYEEVKKNLRICMVNISSNKQLLEKVPYKQHGDFAAIVYYFFKPDGSVRTLLNNDVLRYMQTDFSTVFKDAYINMLGQFQLSTIEDLLYELLSVQGTSSDMDMFTENVFKQMSQGIKMYVLTSKNGVYGASALCYPEELQKASETLKGDYVIIPASVHELILMSFRAEVNLETIRELIHTVNTEEVAAEDRLSDEVYVYSCKEKEVLRGNEYLQREQIENARQQEERQAARDDGRLYS